MKGSRLPLVKQCIYPWLCMAALCLLHGGTGYALPGDIAPRGDADGRLDARDLVLALDFINGRETPSVQEYRLCDVAPFGLPDGTLDTGDYLLLQRAALGAIELEQFVLHAPSFWGGAGPVHDNPYRVAGVADPGVVVNLYRDKVRVTSVVSAGNGLFGFDVALDAGVSHELHVTAGTGSSESDASDSIIVQWLQTPASPDLQRISVGQLQGIATVTGETGSVGDNAMVIVTLVSGEQRTVNADSDGAFSVVLEAGEQVASIRQSAGNDLISEPATITAPGSTAGAFEVNPAGAATYSVPIAVPPGSAGMTPDLALVYDSNGGNGPLGRGWSLGGLSAITRCPQTVAQDGQPGGVLLDSNDRFCLDGQRLVAVSGAYGEDQTEYRTEIETFTRITSSSSTGGFPDSFRAWTKSGQIIDYGATPDAAFNPGDGEVLHWGVSRVTDRMGNYYRVVYHEDLLTNEHYPERIEYTGNDTTNPATVPYSSVELVYSTRPDAMLGYTGGRSITTTKRMTRVRVRLTGLLVREYRIAYDTSPVTGLSRLISITECDGDQADAVCLLPTRFAWSGDQRVYAAEQDTLIPTTNSEYVHTLDINGDGRQDLLYPDTNSGQWKVRVGKVDGFDHEIPMDLNTSGYRYAQVLDYDADGRDDLLVPSADDTWHIYHSNGFQFEDIPTGIPRDGYKDNYQIMDVNGDGRRDLVYVRDYFWRIRLNSATGFGAEESGGSRAYIRVFEEVGGECHDTGNRQPASDNAWPFDYNGDGRMDLLWVRPGDAIDPKYALSGLCVGGFFPTWHVLQSTGDGFTLIDTGQDYLDFNNNTLILDSNGDGRHDVAIPENGWRIWHNSGAGLADRVDTGQAYNNSARAKPADFNADGRTDIFVVDGGENDEWKVLLSRGDGTFSVLPTGISGNNSTYARIADFNGDGQPDLARPVNGSWKLSLSTAPAADRLIRITNGAGITTAIEYHALTEGQPYYYKFPAGISDDFPEQLVMNACYVVTQTRSSDGIGGDYAVDYRYGGAKVHLQGRGLLGFREVTVTDQQSGIRTMTTYHQDFPFIGLVEASRSEVNNRLLSVTSNTRESVPGVTGSVYFSYVATSTEIEYEYRENGSQGPELSRTVTSTTYDGYGNPLTIDVTTSDPGGNVFAKATTNSYGPPDIANWVLDRVYRTEVTHTASNVPAPHNQVTKTSEFDYYDAGDPQQFLLKDEIIEPDAGPGSPLYLKTTHEYDDFGNRVRVTTTGLKGYQSSSGTESRRTGTQYDALGRFQLVSANALDQVETYGHDERFGTKTRLTGPNGLTTTWAYDSFGRKVRETRADGTETAWRYDFCPVATCPHGGFVETVTTSGSAPVITYHDALQRPIRTETVAYTGQTVNQDTGYDNRGNVASRTRPYFANGLITAQQVTTSFEFDVLNRPTSEQSPDGGIVDYDYAGFARNTRRHHVNGGYDQYDTRVNDAMGQLTAVIDAMNGSQSYLYDAVGHLVRTTDNDGNTILTGYDLRGRKTGMDDPDMGKWIYKYNAFGELVEQTDARGQVVSMVYDKLGRMVSRSEPDGTGTWVYDTAPTGAGRLASVSHSASGHTRSHAYDSLGRLVSVTSTIDGETFVMSYSYDGCSRRETVTYPTGFMVRNVYDANGFLSEVRHAANDSLYWQLDEQDAEGRVTLETLGNGLQTVRTFNTYNGSYETITTGFGAGASVQHLAYAFDALGNLKSRQDLRQENDFIENFTYDDLNRLRTADVAGVGGRSYDYDALGNIMHKSDFGDNYSYGGTVAGPHAVTDIRLGGISQATYAYDANGNMKSGDGRSIAWTSFNKALSIQKGVTIVSFAYDADHNRVKQGEGDRTTYYLSPRIDAATHYEKEIENGQAIHTHYIYAGGRHIATYTQSDTAAGKTRYLHTDHLGSTDVVTDENGAVMERTSFTAFGSRRHADWDKVTSVLFAIETHHGFTGHEHLDKVGLIHMNGRLYDPKLGRFLSPDPHIQYPDRTQSFNRYTYVNNNPLSHTDQSGFGFFSKLWKKVRKAVAAVVVGVAAFAGFAWGAVYFMSTTGAIVTGATFAGFSYGAMTGGFRGAVAGAAAAYGIASTLTGTPDAARSVLRGLKSVIEKTATSVSAAVEHVVKWAGHQYVNLKTRQAMQRLAKRNGLSLAELNFGLGVISVSGKVFFGYDRIRLDGDESFGIGKNETGISGIFENGLSRSVFDGVDTLLTFQGLPTAQGLTLVAKCNGKVTATCLGPNYQGALHGHSLGAAEVSVLKGLGLVDKTVAINAYSLPFTRVAPGGVNVFQGSRDPVNIGIFGGLINIGSTIVDQSNEFTLFTPVRNHSCADGYTSVNCGQ